MNEMDEVAALQVSGDGLTELEAIRLALASFGEEPFPSHVSTLQAVGWLINEHREQVKHNNEVGEENRALADELAEVRAALVKAEPKADETVYASPMYARVPTVDIVRALAASRDSMRRNWGSCHKRQVESEAERDALRIHLADALEGMQDMVGYVGDYFREKWGHDDYIARAKAALDTQPNPSPEAWSEASQEEAQP